MPADDAARLQRFADALRVARGTAGVSQRTLGERVGLSQNAISSWEAGDTEPSCGSVFAAEEALSLPGGTLSSILGYVPVDSGDTCTFETAVLRDDALDGRMKSSLLAFYRRAVASSGGDSSA